MKLALIDLGSNSARMSLVERTSKGNIVSLARRRTMVRLAEGMERDGSLQEASIQRAIAVLGEFAKEASAAGAEIVAVATAAVRKAENREAFCRRVQEESGICLKVISGQQEAQLDFRGVLAALPEEKDYLIADIGGGSTELILVKDRSLKEKVSLPFGAMTLTDRYFRKTHEEAAMAAARDALLPQLEKVPFFQEAKGFPVIGMGGSFGALPQLDGRLFGGDVKTEPHGYCLSAARVAMILAALCRRTPKERIRELGLEAGRADTICGGILPGLLLLQKLEAPYLKVCAAGLREGILALMEEQSKKEGDQRPEQLWELLR